MPDEPHRSGRPRREPRREQPPGAEARISLGLGEVFKGLGNVVELVAKMAEEGVAEVSRTQEVHGPGNVRGVYGFSIKMGVGGLPTLERFGNIRSTERGPEVSETREPLVDVFDEGDHVLVVAELPGVAESDICVETKDDVLALSADGRNRKYAREVLLPAMVEPGSLRQSFQSGILEVRLRKAGRAGPKR